MSGLTSRPAGPVGPSEAHVMMSTQKVSSILRRALETMLARGCYGTVDLKLTVDIENGAIRTIRTSHPVVYTETHKPNSMD